MSLPAHILERLPQNLRKNSLIQSASSLLPPAPAESEGALERLLAGELPPGAIVELVQRGRGAGGTTLALGACQRAQARGQEAVFIDPSRSLHAPGVAARGIALERLLVVEPELSALGRVAVRLAESRLFGVLVIDTLGCTDREEEVLRAVWARVVRRVASAVENTESSVVLLSSRERLSSLPLPVKLRIELSRVSTDELGLRMTKNQQGPLAGPRKINLRRLAGGGAEPSHFSRGAPEAEVERERVA